MFKNYENREACPEFFINFDYYCNLNCAFFGFQQNGNLVDDIRLDKVENNCRLSGNLYSNYFKYVF